MKTTKLATIWFEDDGTIETRVHLTWPTHRDWPAQLGQALAEAMMRVMGGESAVEEFRLLNAPTEKVQ